MVDAGESNADAGPRQREATIHMLADAGLALKDACRVAVRCLPRLNPDSDAHRSRPPTVARAHIGCS
jgi:hypothetical protein